MYAAVKDAFKYEALHCHLQLKPNNTAFLARTMFDIAELAAAICLKPHCSCQWRQETCSFCKVFILCAKYKLYEEVCARCHQRHSCNQMWVQTATKSKIAKALTTRSNNRTSVS